MEMCVTLFASSGSSLRKTDRHKGEETRGITLEHSACLMARACYFSTQLRSPARGKTARYCLKKGRVSVLTSRLTEKTVLRNQWLFPSTVT